jgi:hypothetical protein
VSGSSDESSTIWNFTAGVRIIPGVVERARWRNTLMWHPHHRISLGVEYNPLVDDVGPLANIILVQETEKRPAVILGTSSDRIGTPSGRAFYMTVSKDLQHWTGLPIAPYAGISYGTYDDEAVPVGGINWRITESVSSMLIFDGHKVHPTLTWTTGKWSIGAILAFGNQPGITINRRF